MWPKSAPPRLASYIICHIILAFFVKIGWPIVLNLDENKLVQVDLVTMLEKAINYVKFLQLQVKVLMIDRLLFHFKSFII